MYEVIKKFNKFGYPEQSEKVAEFQTLEEAKAYAKKFNQSCFFGLNAAYGYYISYVIKEVKR